MKEAINKQNLKEEFYTSEKCYITELSNTLDDPDISIARARVEPGVTTNWHRLKGTYERYFIISGIGLVEVGKQQRRKYPLVTSYLFRRCAANALPISAKMI